MEVLAVKYYRNLGITLIEVLIALAIISIALTAIIKASSQNIRNTSYLQEKTVAMWVGKNVLNEVRVGLLKLSSTPIKASTTMLGHEWYYTASLKRTRNTHIKKIEVKVFATQDRDQTSPLVNLEGFSYDET